MHSICRIQNQCTALDRCNYSKTYRQVAYTPMSVNSKFSIDQKQFEASASESFD